MIFFPLETLKALVKAGCKSADLSDSEEVYRGMEIDSREIVQSDFAIIKKLIQKDEFIAHLENRRILKKLKALEDLKGSASDKKSSTLKVLELIPEAIRDVIGKLPHKWVFRTDEVYGAMMPYFVEDAEYHAPNRDSNGYTPAKVSIVLRALSRGEEDDRNITLYKADLKGSLVEILGHKDAIPETPDLVADYEADLKYYKEHHQKTGDQYLAVGRGRPSDSSSWSGKFVNLERDGRPTKVVMDDLEDLGGQSAYTQTDFWSRARVKRRGGDENEESFPLPVHPVVSVFSLDSHEFVDAHITSLKPYQYDPAIVSKLILPDDHKQLIGKLTEDSAARSEDIIRGKASGVIILCSGVPGTGKCLGKGTPILMANGRILPVEEVRSGDRLMGPDGNARVVLSINRGSGPLYRVDPIKGLPWVCNDVHVLTLVHSGTNKIIDIALNDYLKNPYPAYRTRLKLFTAKVREFEVENVPLPVDPYFLGVWFGDGEKTLRKSGVLRNVNISKPDPEVRELCHKVAAHWDLKVREDEGSSGCPNYHISAGNAGGSSNPLLDAMRDLIGSDLAVPHTCMTASWDERREFLAGFLDADAELSCGCFIITQKREDYIDAVAFIAQSLGLRATKTVRTSRDQNGTEGVYYVATISGNTDMIPMRIPRKRASPRKQNKDATRTGFRVTPLGAGDYYGFTLEGDGRFLLGDFTVTHNTLTAEIYSEVVKRPLYSVQCAQLGTNEEELEKELSEVLDRAARWRAPLLIDEADVYIHERGNNIRQNAIVGVFLRLLEYFRGIMFMTTNRQDVVDDAILSRVTAHVRYTPPEGTERIRKLWSLMAAQFGAVNLDVDAAMKEFPGISGRSVRQLIRLSAMTHPQKEISVKTLKWSAKFYDFPELPDRKEKS